MGGVGEGDVDRGLGTVAGGLDSDHFIPAGVVGPGGDGFAEVIPAVAVHGAVEVDGGFAIAVSFDNSRDVGALGDIGGTLVVKDDVEVFGPVVGGVNGEGGFGGFVRVDSDVDDGVEAGFDAVLKNLGLGGVVVATTSGDDEDAKGFGFFSLSLDGRVEASSESG